MIETKDNQASIWQIMPSPNYTTLQKSHQTDVCIIGAGISGLTIAYTLLKNGYSVTIIDDGAIGGRQTLRTTGHISNAYDDRYFHIESLHGKDAAKIIADSHTAAIKYVRNIVKTENIDCDLQNIPGYLFLSPKHDLDYLRNEETAALKAGVNVKLLSHIPELGSTLGPALQFKDQSSFHAGKYILGLAKVVQRLGGKIYHNTRATEIITDERLMVVTKDNYRIHPKNIVVATNTPVNTTFQIHSKQNAYRSYVVTIKSPKKDFPNVLLWNTDDPYIYVRKYTEQDQDYLVIGGEDHRTGQNIGYDPYHRLETWAKNVFPYLGETVATWSGQIIEPVDDVAYIGKLQDNVYIVTGDSGNGLTYGTIAGILIPDLISGITNIWSTLYDPHRVSLRASDQFIKENVNTAFQYTDWLTGGEVYSEQQIQLGEGAVLRDGMTKIAAYRDNSGTLHKVSAVCTHLGGILHWNSDEKTWDCPCHGSRFNIKGEVINGPAIQDLKPIEDTDDFLEQTYPEFTLPEISLRDHPIPFLKNKN